MVSGRISYISNSDIQIKYPTNDFFWRYGGNAKSCSERVKRLNSFIATTTPPQVGQISNMIEPGIYSTLFKMLKFIGVLLEYVNKICLKKSLTGSTFTLKRFVYDPVEFDSYVVFMKRLKVEIESYELPDVYDNSLINASNNGDVEEGQREAKPVELLLLYLYHNALNIFLHQLNIVKPKSRGISGARVRNSKNVCIESAIKIAEIFEKDIVKIPEYYRGPHLTVWAFFGLVVLINVRNLTDHPNYKKIRSSYDYLLEILKKYSAYYQFTSYLLGYLDKLVVVKASVCLHNEQYPDEIRLMHEYAITSSDLNHWIIPKDFINMSKHCCSSQPNCNKRSARLNAFFFKKKKKRS